MAQAIIQQELGSVTQHIAKRWGQQPSAYDAKWEHDLSEALILIVHIANHLTPGTRLKKAVLVELLNDYFDLAAADCAKSFKKKTTQTCRNFRTPPIEPLPKRRTRWRRLYSRYQRDGRGRADQDR